MNKPICSFDFAAEVRQETEQRGAWLRAMLLAQDALSQCITSAEMPDTLLQQVNEAYEALSEVVYRELQEKPAKESSPLTVYAAEPEVLK